MPSTKRAQALCILLTANTLSGCASGPEDAAIRPPPAPKGTSVEFKVERIPCDLPADLMRCPAEIAPTPAMWKSKAANEANKAENIVAGDLCRQKLDATRQLYEARCRPK